MNCQKCNFYCYDDEYICPNCEALLERELPIDKNERFIFISKRITEFKERKRAVKIIKQTKKFSLMVLTPINLIFGAWFNTFRVFSFHIRTHYNTVKWSIVFALVFYIILLGKPAVPSNKSYLKIVSLRV